MLPFSLKLGPFTISPEELMALLGIAVAAILVRRRMQILGVDFSALFDIALAGLIGGAVGAKLIYFLPLLIRGERTAGDLLASWSQGSAFYGGIIGGTLAAIVMMRLKKLPVLRVVDAGFTVVPIGFAAGKVGCFLAGCCYGLSCPEPLGFRFAPGSLAFQTQRKAGLLPPNASSSLPVHATQLYEFAFGIALFAVLWTVYRRSKRPGETALAWFVLYAIWRFAIEFLRDDPDRHVFGYAFLSDSQVVALIVGAVAAAGWIWLRLQAVPAPQVPEPPSTVEPAK